jgi:hypothetical protein
LVDPDDGMVMGHWAWSAEKSMQIALSTLWVAWGLCARVSATFVGFA